MDNILFLGNGINLRDKEDDYSISSIYNKIKNGIDPSDYDLKGVSFSMLFESLMNVKGYSYVYDGIKKHFNEIKNRNVNEQIKERILNLTSNRFSQIFTTNYDFNIETKIFDYKVTNLKNISKTKKIYSYKVRHPQSNNEILIKHLHGDFQNGHNICLGKYEYSKKIKTLFDKFSLKKSKAHQLKIDKMPPWAQSFLMDNIYIVGFSLSFDEIDIWHLISLRAFYISLNVDIKNKIYFFDIFEQGNRLIDPDLYKTLLQRYNVEYVPLIKTNNNKWVNLYIEAFDNILNNNDAIN